MRSGPDVPFHCCDVEGGWAGRWVVVVQLCGHVDQSVFGLDNQCVRDVVCSCDTVVCRPERHDVPGDGLQRETTIVQQIREMPSTELTYLRLNPCHDRRKVEFLEVYGRRCREKVIILMQICVQLPDFEGKARPRVCPRKSKIEIDMQSPILRFVRPPVEAVRLWCLLEMV